MSVQHGYEFHSMIPVCCDTINALLPDNIKLVALLVGVDEERLAFIFPQDTPGDAAAVLLEALRHSTLE